MDISHKFITDFEISIINNIVKLNNNTKIKITDCKDFDGYIVMTDGGAEKPKTCISKRCWVLLPNTQLAFQPDKRDTVVKMS